MKPPSNAKVTEWSTSTSWFDEHGIFCSVSKKAPPQSIDQMKKNMAALYEITGGKKICLLIDVTNSSESTKEARDYAASEFPKLVKAIAMVSDSALGKMMANLFFSIKKQPYPSRMFNDEHQAREWLKKYL